MNPSGIHPNNKQKGRKKTAYAVFFFTSILFTIIIVTETITKIADNSWDTAIGEFHKNN